ncbi:MAG: hypothetical protein KUG81_06550, partial [Gammaproteobacteria bacterium]|nr:hypothetical protein [Gammaproteobacteria bacterium]
MKFKNIKAGDTVMTADKVVFGFNRSEKFFTPKKVTKVTPKQFIVGANSRYKKEDGCGLGSLSHERAYNLGDKQY